MADPKIFDADLRKKLLKNAGKTPVSFAVGLDPKPADSILVVHKVLAGKKLFTEVKKETGCTKGAWGTVSLDGRVMTFDCEKVVSGLTKVLRVLLKAEKLPFKPFVIGDDDPGEDDAVDAPESAASSGATDDAVADEGGSDASAPTAPILAALNKMSPAIKAAVAAEPGRKAEIVGAVGAVKNDLDAGDAASAKAKLVALAGMLKVNAGAKPAATDFKSSLTEWRAASESVDGQISSLQAALRGTKDPDFERIAEFGLNGITGKRRVSLQTALIEFGSASADKRAAKASAALAAVTAYRNFLETDEVMGLVDENPFVSTTIRSTLDTALAGLEGSLAAAS